MSGKLKVVDVIKHGNKRFIQTFIVLNRFPEFVYERNGIWLMAEDSGFFDFYKYIKDPFAKAFAGRNFKIPLKSGEEIEASGQWWDYVPSDYSELIIDTGVNTPEGLGECNVFRGMYVDPQIPSAWLERNNPSNNYHKYDARHKNFMEHTIESQWE